MKQRSEPRAPPPLQAHEQGRGEEHQALGRKNCSHLSFSHLLYLLNFYATHPHGKELEARKYLFDAMRFLGAPSGPILCA